MSGEQCLVSMSKRNTHFEPSLPNENCHRRKGRLKKVVLEAEFLGDIDVTATEVGVYRSNGLWK